MRYKVHILLVITILSITACGNYESETVIPNDDVSKYISIELGEDFAFLGSSINTDNGLTYEYECVPNKLSQENIKLFLDVTSSLPENNNRICVVLTTPISNGSWVVLSLKNYRVINNEEQKNKTYLDYSGMFVYRLTREELPISALQDLSTYTCINDIRYLYVPKKMQEKADEEGVDWYEIWPELEGVEVF